MNTKIKKEEVVTNINQPHNFTEGDVVTLVLNEGGYKDGGKLLKNDKISDKHYTGTFYSGNEYMFVKRKGDKVLLVTFYGGRIQYPHCWVDISEIYHPFDGKVDKIDDNDSVEFKIELSYPISDKEMGDTKKKALDIGISMRTSNGGRGQILYISLA